MWWKNQCGRPAMQAVTVEEASQAAADHLRPDRMAIVTVGDPALAEPLTEAGFGPLTVVTDADEGVGA